MRIYSYQLEKHILPTLGEFPVRNIGVAQIEACLSRLKQKGHATSTLRSVRATFATVLRSAVKRGHLEKNPAHGIVIREGDSKKERRFYSVDQVRMLLGVLTEPCASVVAVAVLTGIRIARSSRCVGSASTYSTVLSKSRRTIPRANSYRRKRRVASGCFPSARRFGACLRISTHG